MTTTEILQRRWLELCARLGIHNGEPEWTFLLASYTEPARFYHNLAHIRDCLGHLDMHRPLAANPDAIEMAIWFHDVIYDPRSKGNEEDSARRAWEFLGNHPLRDEVLALIIATKHSGNPPLSPEKSLMRDIDLSILGADAPAYDAYASAIRHEYQHVPDDAYTAGRSAVLSGFLAQPHIFTNPPFADSMEQTARKNLAAEIQRLAASSIERDVQD